MTSLRTGESVGVSVMPPKPRSICCGAVASAGSAGAIALVALGFRDGTLRLYDPSTLTELYEMTGANGSQKVNAHQDAVSAVALVSAPVTGDGIVCRCARAGDVVVDACRVNVSSCACPAGAQRILGR